MTTQPTSLSFDSIAEAIAYFNGLPKAPPAPKPPRLLFQPSDIRTLVSRYCAAKTVSNHMYLYVMTCGRYCKIGISIEPSIRMMGLQAANPIEIRLAGTWNFYSRAAALDAELILHRAFAAKRTFGEWFAIKPELALRYAGELHRQVEQESGHAAVPLDQ